MATEEVPPGPNSSGAQFWYHGNVLGTICCYTHISSEMNFCWAQDAITYTKMQVALGAFSVLLMLDEGDALNGCGELC